MHVLSHGDYPGILLLPPFTQNTSLSSVGREAAFPDTERTVFRNRKCLQHLSLDGPPTNTSSPMLNYLFNLRTKPPLQKGAVRAGIFFVLLLPITALFNYLAGTPAAWSVGTFVEISVASVLYALFVHYFWDEKDSSDRQDQPPPTTRSPR